MGQRGEDRRLEARIEDVEDIVKGWIGNEVALGKHVELVPISETDRSVRTFSVPRLSQTR